MAEVEVVAQPEISPSGTFTGLFIVGLLALGVYELSQHESNVISFFQGLVHPTGTLPPSNISPGTGSTNTNQNPGTTSQGPTSPSTVTQNVITIGNTNDAYGILGLLPDIAALEGKVRMFDDHIYPGPCDKVSATITLINNTPNDYDVTLYGYLIPAGQAQIPSSAVGHFWPGNAEGIVSGTKYTGIYPGKIKAKSQLNTVNVASGPISTPNEVFGVLWQVYITGEPSYTSQHFDALRITTRFTTTPHCS